MKKLIAVVCILTTLFTTVSIAYACDNQIIMSNDMSVIDENETYNEECTYWITDEHSLIVGIAKIEERNIECSLFSSNNICIRGIMDDGIIRAKGTSKLIYVENKWYGLTPIEVQITIYDQYNDLVKNIVKRQTECEDVNGKTIIAATIWRNGNNAAHIFFMPSSNKIEVGYIRFVKQNLIVKLYVGYLFDYKDLFLGFVASKGCPTTVKETETSVHNPVTTPKPNNNNSNKSVTKTECKKKVETNQIQINTTYNNTITNIGNFTNTTNTINNNTQNDSNFQIPFSPVIINPILKQTLLTNCNK